MNRLSEYSQNLGALLEIPIKVTVELGSCYQSTREVMLLGPGTVVEFDQTGNDSLNLYVNQALVARGQMVTSEGVLGIKITEVIQYTINDQIAGAPRNSEDLSSR